MGVSTETPGIAGEDRRVELWQRLCSVGGEDGWELVAKDQSEEAVDPLVAAAPVSGANSGWDEEDEPEEDEEQDEEDVGAVEIRWGRLRQPTEEDEDEDGDEDVYNEEDEDGGDEQGHEGGGAIERGSSNNSSKRQVGGVPLEEPSPLDLLSTIEKTFQLEDLPATAPYSETTLPPVSPAPHSVATPTLPLVGHAAEEEEEQPQPSASDKPPVLPRLAMEKLNAPKAPPPRQSNVDVCQDKDLERKAVSSPGSSATSSNDGEESAEGASSPVMDAMALGPTASLKPHHLATQSRQDVPTTTASRGVSSGTHSSTIPPISGNPSSASRSAGTSTAIPTSDGPSEAMKQAGIRFFMANLTPRLSVDELQRRVRMTKRLMREIVRERGDAIARKLRGDTALPEAVAATDDLVQVEEEFQRVKQVKDAGNDFRSQIIEDGAPMTKADLLLKLSLRREELRKVLAAVQASVIRAEERDDNHGREPEQALTVQCIVLEKALADAKAEVAKERREAYEKARKTAQPPGASKAGTGAASAHRAFPNIGSGRGHGLPVMPPAGRAGKRRRAPAEGLLATPIPEEDPGDEQIAETGDLGRTSQQQGWAPPAGHPVLIHDPTAQPPPLQGTAQMLVKQALELQAKGRKAEAEDMFRQAAESSRPAPEPWDAAMCRTALAFVCIQHHRANFLWRSKKSPGEAGEVFEDATRVAEAVEGHRVKSGGSTSGGKPQKGVSAAPGTLFADFGSFLAKEKMQTDRAYRLFERALELAPGQPLVLGNFARFLTVAMADYARAEALFEQALALAPNQVQLLLNYAQLKKAVERYDEAQELYDRALIIDPHNSQALNNYANFLWRVRGDKIRARQVYIAGLEAAKQRGARDKLLSRNYAIFLSRNPEMRTGATHLSVSRPRRPGEAHEAFLQDMGVASDTKTRHAPGLSSAAEPLGAGPGGLEALAEADDPLDEMGTWDAMEVKRLQDQQKQKNQERPADDP